MKDTRSICCVSSVPAPSGFNIHCSTSQWIAQFSVFFLFFLILFKFDAVLVLVWYTLYKIYEYEHQFVSPRNLLKRAMTHTKDLNLFISDMFKFGECLCGFGIVSVCKSWHLIDVQLLLINVWAVGDNKRFTHRSLITARWTWTRWQCFLDCPISVFTHKEVQVCVITSLLPLIDLLHTSLNKCFNILTCAPPGNTEHAAVNFLPSARRDHAGLALHL